ncbi:integration host factor subunit beta [Swingsia samuiensis]|uniref:Integration host factor subunit beta n=1 Tax=Swingsia samuiensis TaxID=1293412 RepID=A0A4Y6UIQ8_9PROT|nr:integration host factor subunit beta [Swingsia samuiensis]QDH16247.1 integration host factor subunit beta [Swingsia samuiensis]
MTKSELIAALSAKYPHLLMHDIEKIVFIIFDEISSALERGDRVELRGFGTFIPRQREARRGRNPKTGTAVAVEEKKVPFFKMGKELRERINKTK